MAAEAPDPKTFRSWEDAFQYAVPAVRRMEKQLRNDIAGNKEKLRTLVGASYRDLMGTAQSIVEMNDQIGYVEASIASLGQRCNTRLLEKSSSNVGVLERSVKAYDRDRIAFGSQLAFLRSCPEAVARLLRKGGTVLLPAKILVMARLLHKKLSKYSHAIRYIDAIRDRLAILRRKLLARIDQRLGNPCLPKDGIFDAMCAFSLSTSSSAADVLRHFHQVRGEVVTARRPVTGDVRSTVLEALQCWVQTLRDTRTMFPQQLSNMLAKLRTTSILDDPAVLAIDELDCETHVKWVGDEIKCFMPYVIHDNLQLSSTASSLAAWASNTFHAFLSILGHMLAMLHDLPTLEEVRTGCISLLLSNRSYIIGIQNDEILSSLRDAFLQRFITLVKDRTDALAHISLKITNFLSVEELERLDQGPSSWEKSLDEMGPYLDVNRLTRSLNNNLYNSTNEVHEVKLSYRAWVESITEFCCLIKRLQESRWLDDIYDIDDDEDTLESLRSVLIKDDPEAIHQELLQSLERSFDALRSSIGRLIKDSTGEAGSEHKAALLLRILREIGYEIPNTDAVFYLDTDVVLDMHTCISKSVLSSTSHLHCATITKAITHWDKETRDLWYGEPALPTLPSPWTIELLRSQHSAMTALGNDLWSPPAVRIAKMMLRNYIAETVRDSRSAAKDINRHELSDSNLSLAEAPEENIIIANGDTQHRDKHLPRLSDATVQLVFDMAYIDAITSDSEHSGLMDVFEEQVRSIKMESGLAATSMEKLKSNAIDYRKRTCSLFFLFA